MSDGPDSSVLQHKEELINQILQVSHEAAPQLLPSQAMFSIKACATKSNLYKSS